MVKRLAAWLRTRPFLGRASLALIPNLPVTIIIHPIGPFRIRLSRDRRYWLRHPLDHERMALGGLQRLIRPGDTVYDIGANIGLFSRFLINAFNARQVFAFEPMKANLRDLHTNLALGRIADRARVFPLALADHEAHELLQVDDVSSGSAVLDRVSHGRASESRQRYGLAAKTESVRVATLDSLIARESLPPPNVLKIDVEGAEALVLKGAARTIQQHKPRLLIELHSVHGPSTAYDCIPLLEEWGYALYCHGWSNNQGWSAPIRTADLQNQSTERFHFHMLFAAESASLFDPPITEFRDP
jgi:FkbM family methyltransferase